MAALCLPSVLGCPVARKRRLEEAELEQEQQDAEKPASKRKAHPLKLALDEGFSAESDGSSEAEGEEPGEAKEGEESGDAKEEEEQQERQDAKGDGEEATPHLKNGHEDETMKEEEEERKEEEEASQQVEETPAAGWSQCVQSSVQWEIFGFIYDFYIGERFNYCLIMH